MNKKELTHKIWCLEKELDNARKHVEFLVLLIEKTKENKCFDVSYDEWINSPGYSCKDCIIFKTCECTNRYPKRSFIKEAIKIWRKRKRKK